MGTHRTRAEGDSTSAYTSEANRAAAGTVNAKFSVRVTRKFPGVPKSVEEFKEKIIERAGVTGVRQLGRLLKIMDTSGEGLLSRKEFKFGLAVRTALAMGASAVLWLWSCGLTLALVVFSFLRRTLGCRSPRRSFFRSGTTLTGTTLISSTSASSCGVFADP